MSLDFFAMDEVFLSALARSAIEGALAVGVVALVLRLIPRTPPSVAALLWWLACARFVVGLSPISQSSLALPVAVNIPAVPALHSIKTVDGGTSLEQALDEAAHALANSYPEEERVPAFDASSLMVPGVFALWLAGALVCFLRGTRAVIRSRRALATDSEDPSPEDRQLLFHTANMMGLQRVPRLRLSSSAPTPHLLSVGSPTIVLPKEVWSRLDAEHRAMILAHELVHLRRRDEMWSWLPWLVEGVFWFHPFAKIAAAEFALAREAACDAEVMRRLDASPRRYGELLLRLGIAPQMSWAGIGVAPGFRSLRRRISMLDRTMILNRRSVLVLALAVVATFLPIRFENGPEAKTNSTTRTTTSTSSSASEDDDGTSTSWFWDDGDNDGKSFYLFDGKDVRMMGAFNEAEHALVLAERDNGKRQIVMKDRRSTYVIDDPKIMDQAREIFRSLEPMERKQSELGILQSELGVKQSKLGRQQSELGLQMAKYGERMAELQVELQRRIRDDGDTGGLETEIEAIGREMQELGDAQGALGQQQGEIGQEQSKIGERQSEIGEEQTRESRKARNELEKLVERAKDQGLAQKIK